MKPLLIGLAVLAVVGVLGAWGAWSWLRSAMVTMDEETMKGLEQGAEIGRHMDEARCLALAKERATVMSTMTSSVANASYLEGCLLTARPTPNFCRVVPLPDSEHGEVWIRKECPGDPAKRQECRLLAQTAQRFCGDGARKVEMGDVRAYVAERRAARR